jgi:hypothetical protein
VVVLTQQLQTALETWGAKNPGSIRDVLSIPALNPQPGC